MQATCEIVIGTLLIISCNMLKTHYVVEFWKITFQLYEFSHVGKVSIWAQLYWKSYFFPGWLLDIRKYTQRHAYIQHHHYGWLIGDIDNFAEIDKYILFDYRKEIIYIYYWLEVSYELFAYKWEKGMWLKILMTRQDRL